MALGFELDDDAAVLLQAAVDTFDFTLPGQGGQTLGRDLAVRTAAGITQRSARGSTRKASRGSRTSRSGTPLTSSSGTTSTAPENSAARCSPSFRCWDKPRSARTRSR